MILKVNLPEGTTIEQGKEMIADLRIAANQSLMDTTISIVENKFDKIRAWAEARGIYAKGDPKTQTLKLLEEAGELAKAILKQDKPEIIDAIGDCVVVLTNLAELCNLKIEDCVEASYQVIINRKGAMQNGTFVKQLD